MTFAIVSGARVFFVRPIPRVAAVLAIAAIAAPRDCDGGCQQPCGAPADCTYPNEARGADEADP
jgi:hypothetical protein